MPAPLDEQSLDTLFRTARTHNGWLNKPLPEGTAQRLFDLVKMGPTSANCSPARFVFIESKAAKERLRPTLSPGNVDKTMAAPLAVIVALDTKFYDQLPKLFPHADARSWFADNEAVAALTAFRNGTLQGGYMILAARALGLDVGVMSGFDNGLVDAEFFPDGQYKSNFLMTLGYGDPTKLFDRSPRFDFDEACSIL